MIYEFLFTYYQEILLTFTVTAFFVYFSYFYHSNKSFSGKFDLTLIGQKLGKTPLYYNGYYNQNEFEELKARIDQITEESEKQKIEIKNLRSAIQEMRHQQKVLEEVKSFDVSIDTVTQEENTKVYLEQSEHKDDLKLIKGIGPTIESKVNQLGFYTFRQVSELSEDDIKFINESIKSTKGRIQRDKWKEQAKELLLEKERPQSSSRPSFD